MEPGARSIGTLPAAEIEAAVLAQVHRTLQQPERIVGVLRAAQAHPVGSQVPIDEPTVVLAMRQIGRGWDQMFPVERHRILRCLIERVQLRDDGLDIVWRQNHDHWLDFAIINHPFVDEQRAERENGHSYLDNTVVSA